MKKEALLKAKLMLQLRHDLPHWVHFRHEDQFTSGIPDISTSGLGFTSWLECKHGTPGFQMQPMQHRTMMRLSVNTTRAWYIIWEERKRIKRTMIVHPLYAENMSVAITEATCEGFDPKFVVDFLLKTHV